MPPESLSDPNDRRPQLGPLPQLDVRTDDVHDNTRICATCDTTGNFCASWLMSGPQPLGKVGGPAEQACVVGRPTLAAAWPAERSDGVSGRPSLQRVARRAKRWLGGRTRWQRRGPAGEAMASGGRTLVGSGVAREQAMASGAAPRGSGVARRAQRWRQREPSCARGPRGSVASRLARPKREVRRTGALGLRTAGRRNLRR